MKSIALTLICTLLTALTLPATPDRSTSISERFLGSNRTQFAILRTERDNLGSHYSSRSITWLDEYEKESASRKPTRQTLILDVTTSVDASFTGPYNLVPITQTVNQRDDSLPLSTLLERYPNPNPAPWTEEQTALIETTPNSGISFRRRFNMVDPRKMPESLPPTLDLVTRDSNTVYLQVTFNHAEATETRIYHLPSAVSKMVLDQLQMEPLYLVAETHDSLEAATARLLELRKIDAEKKLYNSNFEIWSASLSTGKTGYHIVEANTRHLIESGRIARTEAALNIRLTPTPSDQFIERFTP